MAVGAEVTVSALPARIEPDCERVIWKWPIIRQSTFGFALPEGAQILAVQPLTGALPETIGELWALCDASAPKRMRYFRVFGTGHPIIGEYPLEYIGTFRESVFVWHLFEELR